MKKIGFIDYYISEWHANNYPKWIKEASEQIGVECSVAYAYAELDVSPVDGVTTDEWCEKFGANRCSSIEELCELSDYICILAPSNPEKHLEYVRAAFPFSKPTYVDKTFAPDYEIAFEIFALAKKYGTPFFSSSALRFADELKDVDGAKSLIVMGHGSDFDEYVIHLCEIAVRIMGSAPDRVKLERQGRSQYVIRGEYDDGRGCTVLFAPGLPYSVCAELEEGHVYRKLESPYFLLLIKEILEFYLSGKAPFNTDETLDVMKLREGAITARSLQGTVIDLK